MTLVMGAVRGLILVTIVFAVLRFCVACSRQEAPRLEPAAAPPPAAPPTPPAASPIRDAGTDAVDAATDAGDGRPAPHRRKAAVPPAEGAGGDAGFKVEGSLSRAEGDKVVRGAQPKLRACFQEANPPGSGRKGRVSFTLTIDDRGHVTRTEIPHSSLPGGNDVETCMAHVLRDLRFPRGSGESSVRFQMSFGR
jgi:hypothetical protein